MICHIMIVNMNMNKEKNMQRKETNYYDIDVDIDETLLKMGLVDDIFYVRDLKQR